MAVLVLGAANASAQAPAPESIASVKQLMTTVVAPASNAIIAAATTTPAGDGEWGRVANQALMLAESGNLLMIGSRVRDRDAWLQMAVALRQGGAAAMKAAAARDRPALAAARNQIAQACGQCHSRYISSQSLRVRPPSK